MYLALLKRRKSPHQKAVLRPKLTNKGLEHYTRVHRGYNGYLIEAGLYRIIFAGDTAYTDLFRQVCTSKAVDLAIMPIGAYDFEMASHTAAEFVLPVHHQTFNLRNEPYEEPIERLLLASGSAENRIAIQEIGQEFHLASR